MYVTLRLDGRISMTHTELCLSCGLKEAAVSPQSQGLEEKQKGGVCPGAIQGSETKGVGMATASGSKDSTRYACGQV